MTIYAAPHSGRRYHGIPCCTGLNSAEAAMAYTATVPTITHAEARRRGLTPCRTCHPPPLLSVVPNPSTTEETR